MKIRQRWITDSSEIEALGWCMGILNLVLQGIKAIG
jgi:hypothetical protein